MNIYVGNLPKTTNSDNVRKAFETFGKVGEVKLIEDRMSNELRGFGFIEMPSKDEAMEAIKTLNGSDLDGRSLVVNEAKPKSSNNSFSNSHGGNRW